MTQEKIERSLKAYLLSPNRCYSTEIPVISNYSDDGHEAILSNEIGININSKSLVPDTTELLGGRKVVVKNHTIDLEFYTKNIGNRIQIIKHQNDIDLFFNNDISNNFEVVQLVELTSTNNIWKMKDLENDQASYDMYGSNDDPDLSEDISYYGYKVRNQNGEHFLYRFGDDWRVLDLSTHLIFNVSRFKGDFAEIFHQGDTHFYKFEYGYLFTGGQVLTVEGTIFPEFEVDKVYGEIEVGITTINIIDRDEDECPEEKETFEYIVSPSHPFNPSIYNNKYLIAATSPDSTFSTAEWRGGNRVTNSLNITFRPTTVDSYRGLALSSDRISSIRQVGNPFGNVISAYNYSGIQEIDNIYYYTYITKNPYFPISETHEYTIEEDDDRDTFLIGYLAGDTSEVHTVDDFSFPNAPIEVDPARPYHEFAIEADTPSYIAILFSGGNINKIMDGTDNIRNTKFNPTINEPFVQKVVRGRIYNAFISSVTFYTITSWRIFYN